jgi:hypothetical protein
MDNKNQLIFKYVSPTTIIAKSVTGKEFEIYAEFVKMKAIIGMEYYKLHFLTLC